MHIIPQKEGENLCKYIQRFSRVQYNIPDVHPAAVISVFHQNVCNRKMREELAMNKVKDVAELYVLADRCAQTEEGRKYPGEDAGVETNSTGDTATQQRRVGAVTGNARARLCLPSRDPTTLAPPRNPRQGTLARRLPGVPLAGPWRLPTSQETLTNIRLST